MIWPSSLKAGPNNKNRNYFGEISYLLEDFVLKLKLFWHHTELTIFLLECPSIYFRVDLHWDGNRAWQISLWADCRGIHLEIPMIIYILGPRTPEIKISRKVCFAVNIYQGCHIWVGPKFPDISLTIPWHITIFPWQFTLFFQVKNKDDLQKQWKILVSTSAVLAINQLM